MGSKHQSNAALPLEIIITIIDYLHDDPPTLAACALVERSWVYCSRSHLFHTLKLRSKNDSMETRFLQLLNPPDTGQGGPTYPTFRLSVRHLVLDQLIWQKRFGTHSVPLSHSLITHISGSNFPNINTLTIQMGLKSIPTPSATLLSSTFRNITSLILLQLVYEEISPVFILLSGFPVLETLEFYAKLPPWSFKHDDDTAGFPDSGFLRPVSSRLCSLKLNCYSTESVYHWLSSPHQELSNLRCLKLVDSFEESNEYIEPLFAKLGSVLEDLKLRFTYNHGKWQSHHVCSPLINYNLQQAGLNLKALNLGCLTRLRTIDIRGSAIQASHILSGVVKTSPLLERICICDSIEQNLDELLSPALIDVLESFGGMDEVKMECMGNNNLAGDAVRAKRHLEILILVYTDIGSPPFDGMTEAEITDIVRATIETLLPVCARQKVLLVRVLV